MFNMIPPNENFKKVLQSYCHNMLLYIIILNYKSENGLKKNYNTDIKEAEFLIQLNLINCSIPLNNRYTSCIGIVTNYS